MKKNNTWIKVVILIIILELVIGGIIFAYKKLGTSDDTISIKDKEVENLYKKIAYYDIESLDVMNPRVMLYYGYKNASSDESINCDVVDITDDTTGYTCEGIVDFIKSDDLEKEVRDIYGPSVTIEHLSFEVDPNHYAFYDEVADGYVLYTKDEETKVDPVNLKLVEAKKDNNNIVLTVEVLDGVFGTTKDTYNYTFTKDGKNYYLIKKEIVTK